MILFEHEFAFGKAEAFRTYISRSYVILRHMHTDTETHRHADTETPRHRETEGQRDTETQRHRDTEKRR